MKKILFSSALLLFALISFAQRPGSARIKAQKTAFITDRLELSPQEAEQFWPVYNQFEKKEKDLRTRYKSIRKEKPASDEEANKMILEHFELEAQLLDLKREKLAGLRGVITPIKIVELGRTERKFKQKMVKAMRKSKRKNKGKRPR